MVTTDRKLLARTRAASTGMDSATGHRVDLGTIPDAHMRRLPFKRSFPMARHPLAVVHMDLFSVDKFNMPKDQDGQIVGFRYALVCVDDYSRLIRVYFAKKKSDIPDLIRLFLDDMGMRALFGSHLTLHRGFARLHCDGGTEFNSREVADVLRKYGVVANVTSAPDTPSSNGVAERTIQTLMTDTRARLEMAKLPYKYWHYAFLDAANARNLMASRRLVNSNGAVAYVAPHHLFYGTRPRLDHVVVFGSPCRILPVGIKDKNQQGKMRMRAERGKVLGYGGYGIQIDNTVRQLLGYVVLQDNGKVVYSRNVEIDERTLLAGGHTGIAGDNDEYEQIPAIDVQHIDDHDVENASDDEGDTDCDPRQLPSETVGTDSDIPPETATKQKELDVTYDPQRRDRILRQRLGRDTAVGAVDIVDDGRNMEWHEPHDVNVNALTVTTLNGEPIQIPRNSKEARTSPQSHLWKTAEDAAIKTWLELNTFREEIVPENTKVVRTRWIYEAKTDLGGEMIKAKARNVVQGFQQERDKHYTQIFAPTIRGEQVRLLLAVAAKHLGLLRKEVRLSLRNAKLLQMKLADVLGKGDVKDAYLQSPLPEGEQILFELPLGYQTKLHAPPGFKVVGRALKALPGMKQAGRTWYMHQRQVLRDMGFTPCDAAPCIYVKETDTGILVIGHFVDDLILVNLTRDPHAFEPVKEEMRGKYEVKYSGSLDKFLGAEFEETEDGLRLHLANYIENITRKYLQQGTTPVDTPEFMAEMSFAEAALLQRADIKMYQEITGALMFTMTTARPDIAHAVNKLARRMTNPRLYDLRAARHVLRYLLGARDYGLLFRFEEDARFPGLVAFADSDWANDPERRKSVTGFVVFFNGVAISWHSGLQSVIALSTCEAEYIALSECCRELAYLREVARFLREPSVEKPTVIFEDNQGTIDLVNNPVHHKRTKHIDVKYHYIRLRQEEGDVKVVKIPTRNNVADLFTKATDKQTFLRHVYAIMHGARRPTTAS